MATPKNNISDKEWRYRTPPEAGAVDRLVAELPGIHPVIAKLMVQRGLTEKDGVKGFFKPDMAILDNAGEMADLDRAAGRLIAAIDKKEKILLYGDYDVDGTCSVAMMWRFLKSLGAEVGHYIPDRHVEGYGVSEQGVEYAILNEIDVMVTLDCGITAGEKLERLTQTGVDVIITDHHLPGDELPKVYAVVNPNRSDCTYRGKQLCGCGVAYILLLRIVDKYKKREFTQDELDEYLAYTTVATCSDIVPLTGVNRAIVEAGMRVLNDNPPIGIRAMLDTAHFDGTLNVSEVVFKIGPRINAAGRLEHANRAVEILTTDDDEKARSFAAYIEKVNGERRSHDKQTAEEALGMMLAADPELKRRTTVVSNPDWHKGIIGIVASRLMETCYRPTVVFTESNGMFVGSGRSVDGFHLHTALKHCAEHIEKFGGHAAAAGLSILPENMELFEEAFERAAHAELAEANNKPKIGIDLDLDLSEWYNEEYLDFYKQLSRMRPFGPSNLAPVFSMRECRAERVKIVGKSHLKFSVYQEHKNRGLPVIAFNYGEYYDHLSSGLPFSIAYAIEENFYRGNRSLQLNAKDIRLG